MGFLIELWRTITILWRTGNRWLRFVIIASVVWPVLISIVACIDSTFITSMTGLVLVVGIAILFIVWVNPLWIPVIAILPGGKRALRFLTVWLGCGVLMAVFFSVISPASNPWLIPLFFLATITAALFLPQGNFFHKAGTFGKWVVMGIALIWLYGQVTSHLATVMPKSAAVVQQKKARLDERTASWLSATPSPGHASVRMSMIPSDTTGLEAYVATRPPCRGEEGNGNISHKMGEDEMIRTLGMGLGCWMRWQNVSGNNIHFEWWTEADHHFCVQIYGIPGIVKCDPTRTWSPFVAGGLRYRVIGDDWVRFEVWDNNTAGR